MSAGCSLPNEPCNCCMKSIHPRTRAIVATFVWSGHRLRRVRPPRAPRWPAAAPRDRTPDPLPIVPAFSPLRHLCLPREHVTPAYVRAVAHVLGLLLLSCSCFSLWAFRLAARATCGARASWQHAARQHFFFGGTCPICAPAPLRSVSCLTCILCQSTYWCPHPVCRPPDGTLLFSRAGRPTQAIMSGAAAANALTKKVSATKEILIGAGLAIAVGCSLFRSWCGGREPPCVALR